MNGVAGGASRCSLRPPSRSASRASRRTDSALRFNVHAVVVHQGRPCTAPSPHSGTHPRAAARAAPGPAPDPATSTGTGRTRRGVHPSEACRASAASSSSAAQGTVPLAGQTPVTSARRSFAPVWENPLLVGPLRIGSGQLVPAWVYGSGPVPRALWGQYHRAVPPRIGYRAAHAAGRPGPEASRWMTA